ncbi:hypothetical protein Rsub_00452 [Raphidocelis subcapitata]|uniref:Protein kinase domain-containing protein n=1 Tax=Raphidocelis subcapitata TaxID=307507 RepID=A0A2V0NKB5_9CHLO|nr:hypothetical protein Rsub_00452 [Raphidocelis subcapitata]|eukprot:GBF87741.1 hypothetical protein Rsub_00452 [Raphidocelis subcapitata]
MPAPGVGPGRASLPGAQQTGDVEAPLPPMLRSESLSSAGVQLGSTLVSSGDVRAAAAAAGAGAPLALGVSTAATEASTGGGSTMTDVVPASPLAGPGGKGAGLPQPSAPGQPAALRDGAHPPETAGGGVGGGGGTNPFGCLRGDYVRNVRERPMATLVPPLLTFLLLCGLSVLGVELGANKFESDTRSQAASAALDWATSFQLSAGKIFTPLVTLGILIQQNPSFPALKKTFPSIARQLLEEVNRDRVVIQELQVSPMGIIELIYPKNAATDQRLGINIFKEPALRGGAIATIQQRAIVLNGPLKLVQGSGFSTIARTPIFIDNATAAETFGTSRSIPDDCGSLCYNNATGDKFWGFATAIGPMDDLRDGNDSRLELLKSKGYRWLMTRPYTATELNDSSLYRPQWTAHGQYVFANSSRWPSNSAVRSEINLGSAVWRLYLEPANGWRPAWERPGIAAVVLGSGLMALMVGLIAASWAQQRHLLGAVMDRNVKLADTTAKLQEEKLRLDALLVRQYLLAVLGGQRAGGGGAGSGGAGSGGAHNGREGGGGLTSSPEGSMSSREGLTLDRIESMRRQLAVNSNTSAQDMESIQTIELLGEGTFGKVYKGLWRGTVVAVKTMILPSNMSGAEKREKMAVMEAAISSSLSHPNVVQTYTYAIRPLREAASSGDSLPDPGGGASVAPRVDSGTRPSQLSVQRSGGSSGGMVHSYEVRLVLEYCDKGCLRDALDDGAFLMVGGVNFPAVLDTAADVAKAMLHLHSLNVLHSDLKARNVMLATGAADGRGVVAKVGDFGLSLKMDHLETHVSQVFQGTLTHCAPEILLDGRVSKAADVYAFGITLWELYTGGHAFKGIPRALLGHAITRERLRPRFPEGAPAQYRRLAERCWLPRWEERPTFSEVLQELLAMRSGDFRATQPLHITLRRHPMPGAPGTPGAAPGAAGSGGGSSHNAGGDGPSPTGSSGSSSGGGGGWGDGGAGGGEGQGAQQRSTGGGSRSFYLEGSLDDSDLDWSRGSSGMSATAPAVARARPLALPQIAESHEGGERPASGDGDAGGDAEAGAGGGGGGAGAVGRGGRGGGAAASAAAAAGERRGGAGSGGGAGPGPPAAARNARWPPPGQGGNAAR